MTARELLTQVLQHGGEILAHSDPEHPRLRVPSALKPVVQEHKEALRWLLLSFEVLHRWRELTVYCPETASPQALVDTYQQLIRVLDELDESEACRLRFELWGP